MADKTLKELQDATLDDAKKREAKKEDEAPMFMVTSAPGFFDGSHMHEPGSKIHWAVPEDWDEERQGKHWASFDPHPDFRPLNDAAKGLSEKSKKNRTAAELKAAADSSAKETALAAAVAKAVAEAMSKK